MNKIIKNAINKELIRQNNNIELIASENYVSTDVLLAQGSILTNKYAEGYPGKRYYGGCENVDIVEQATIETAKKLFNVTYVNVQPHSGSGANMAVYKALLNIGDKVLSMNLSHGGHLTHGHSLNFSGKEYEIIPYGVNKDGFIDYEEIEKLAINNKPKMIIAGASSYSRTIDFEKFSTIAKKVGAYLMVDMAHIAGLVAAGIHPTPVGYADVITTTTHKTLRGPRGGMVLTNDEAIFKKINRIVFPGIQGGPLMHVIAAKGICFDEALTDEFRKYQNQVVKNAKAMSDYFINKGCTVVSNGTDNHLLVLDTKVSFGINGKLAEEKLDEIGITVNKNVIPNDTESPLITSGIRIGTPAMTTRGLKEQDFEIIAEIIIECLKNNNILKDEIKKIVNKYPLYEEEGLWIK